MTPSEALLARALAPANLSSSQWSEIQAGLRDRAFFSARVEEARVLHAMREAAAGVADGSISETDARIAMREALKATGYIPPAGKEGGIQDLASDRRLNLILRTNADMARGYVQHQESMAALDAFPAQELFRVEHREKPRDWRARWKGAGGRLYAGERMIALKTDPIWTKINRFGHPWPPFDFGSGMGVLDVDRAEAEDLGLLKPGQPAPEPKPVPSFNSDLREKVPFTSEEDPAFQKLKADLGDQIVYNGGEVFFKNELFTEALAGRGPDKIRLGKATPALLSALPDDQTRRALVGTSLSVRRQWLVSHVSKHVGSADHDPRNIPLDPSDLELLPTIWRKPDRIRPGDHPGSVVLELDNMFGGVFHLALEAHDGAFPTTFYRSK